MAASMWRMNGLWRRMAGVVLLCALLLSNEVMCQDDAVTDAPAPAGDDSAATVAADPGAAPDATHAPGVDATAAAGGDSAASAAPAAPEHITIPATILDLLLNKGPDGGSSGTTAAPVVIDAKVPVVPRLVVPEVTCVGETDIPEGSSVKAEVATTDCEATKLILQENPAGWCSKDTCNVKIFQKDNEVQVASDDANLATLAEALGSEHLKEKLGATKIQTPTSSSSSVFVGILVSGLLAALAITIGYFKCQRRPDAKGVRLAEESYPVDQENQGNTLVSVAPLNPPPETPEKPSVNGESPEADKTQPPPPTNGTSTTKTADTEL